MTRRTLITLGVLAAVVVLVGLITYEVIGLDWISFMEDQPSIRYQEGPRLQPPDEAISLSRPLYKDDPTTMTNPVPADAVSLQRGAILFDQNCAVCHGPAGQGNGPVTKFWRTDAHHPANLTDARIKSYPDSLLYQVITQGIGAMPPLRENFTERQYWDVINHVRTLQQ